MPESAKPRAAVPPPTAVEANVYSAVYHALVYGMWASTLLFVVGMLRALASKATVPLTTAWVREQMRGSVFWHGLLHADPTALMLLATIVLILTPVSRVVISIYAFFVDRDYRYVLVTSIVFGVIVLTVILSRFGLQ